MKIKKLMFLFVLSFCLFVTNVSALAIDSSGKTVPASNAWEPYFSKSSTVETFGTSDINKIIKNTEKSIFGGEFYRLKIDSTEIAKGTSGVILRNVGEYNNHIVDMKITFMNWSFNNECSNSAEQMPDGTFKFDHDDEAGIEVYPNPKPKSGSSVTEEDAAKLKGHIHFSREGCIRDMEYKIEFLDHNTQAKLQISGHFGIYDIDAYSKQGDDLTAIEYIYPKSGISALYASTDTVCDIHEREKVPNGITCNIENNTASAADLKADDKYKLTMLYNTKELSLVYGYYKKDNTASTITFGAGFAGGQPSNPIEYPTPTKRVSKIDGDSADSIEVSANEEFFFHVKQFLPIQGNDDNKLTSLVFNDQVNSDLQISECHVVNTENGTDYLDSNFNIDCNKNTNKVTATWNGTDLHAIEGQTMMLQIKAKIKSDALSKSSNFKDGVLTVPNNGTVTINNKANNTNEVYVKYKADSVKVPSTLANTPMIVTFAAIILIIVGGGVAYYMTSKKPKTKQDK